MKKAFLFISFALWGISLFAQGEPITFKVSRYQIGSRQTANTYTKAELIINDEAQTWEIILYRKDNKEPEHIKLEQFNDIGRNGVFQTVIIKDSSGSTGKDFFAYMPVFDGNKIRIDLCDKRTEATRRRLILEY